ncbi:MAG: hypothetical protein ACOYOB_20605 [Myxococcota bacterium]
MSRIRQHDTFNPRVNVRVLVYERQQGGALKLVDRRESHNVMTNTGRAWLVQLFGSSNYAALVPTPHTTARLKYVGLGCGGALQTRDGFVATQTELASVIALENPVPVSAAGALKQYLKTVDNQQVGTNNFPGIGRTIFYTQFAESEVSFAGNETALGYLVETNVPVSEAGLYLSTALPTYDGVAGKNPLLANELACYNVFEPVAVRPGVVLRLEWELRLL